MARQLQLRRGTTAQHAVFTGAVGEVTIDTDKDVLVVHDGMQAGGFPAARESDLNDHTTATGNVHNISFSELKNKPTTIEGYGITNSISNHSDLSGAGIHTHDELDADMSKIGDIRYTMAEVDSTWLVADDRIYSENDYPTLSTVIGKKEVDIRLEIASGAYNYDNGYTKVAFGNNRYVASTGGYLFISDNGLNFIKHPSNISCSQVIFANNMFVIGAYSSTYEIYYSYDGILFNQVSLPSSANGNILCLKYINNLFIATTNSMDIASSVDGVNWITNSISLPFSIYSIAYGKGVYVACITNAGKPTSNIMTSSDLVNWTVIDSGFARNMVDIIYEKGIFVACGLGILTSSNGISWSYRGKAGFVPSATSVIRFLEYRDNKFIAYGDNLYSSSSADGVTWSGSTFVESTLSGESIVSVCHSDKYTLIGCVTFFTTPSYWALPSSYAKSKVSDVEHIPIKYWKAKSVGSTLTGIDSFKGRYVVASLYEGFYVSTDLENWTKYSAVSAFGVEGVRFVCSGSNVIVAFRNGLVASSIDGIDWTSRAYPIASGVQLVYCVHNIPATPKFISGGVDHIAYSSDGISWSLVSAFAGAIVHGIASSSSYNVIAVGSSRKIAYSTDGGLSWSTVVSISNISSSSTSILGIAYGNGRYIIACSDKKLLTSLDNGATWSFIPDPGIYPHSIQYINGMFIVTGEGVGAYSYDGNEWFHIKISGQSSPINKVINFNGRLVAVTGNYVAICSTFGVESPEFLVPNVTSQYVPAYIKGE